MACEVCDDTGTYPVITRSGKTLYEIRCPECAGLGMEIVAPQSDEGLPTAEDVRGLFKHES